MENDLKKVSIRGRLAYALYCFEQLLIKNGIEYSQNEYLFSFIEKLWDVCSENNIESIEEYINEIAPYSILDDNINNDFNDYTFVSYENAVSLKSFYLTLPENIIQAMNILTEIAFGNLYGDTGSYSEITYVQLLKINEIFKKYDIDLTDFQLKIESSFKELKGWGNPHPRTMWQTISGSNK